jgi:hypothetical protein
LPATFGADDATFKLATIGDLEYGGLLKTGGRSTQYGIGKMRFNVVVASVNKAPVPPPSPGASPGVVKRSHAVNYAVAMGNEHKTSTGNAADGTVTGVASFGRVAWDATDKALNGAVGIQLRRAFRHTDAASSASISSSALASVGYRATESGTSNWTARRCRCRP